MFRVSWVERRTNENVLNEINETRKILSTIKIRRWSMIGYVLRHEEELPYIIIEGKMNGKRDRGRPRTSYVKRIISDVGLANYKELKRLADNRDEKEISANCKTNLKVDHKKKYIYIQHFIRTYIHFYTRFFNITLVQLLSLEP
jgi:hypothetical protein